MDWRGEWSSQNTVGLVLEYGYQSLQANGRLCLVAIPVVIVAER
jgi:hypothetical protein